MSQAADLFRDIRDISRTATYITKGIGVGYEQLGLICKITSGHLFSEQSDETHLKAVMSWLGRAQDACGGEGVSASYHINRRWDVAYPETSGYIIPTFFAYSDYCGDLEWIKRAVQIGNWEIKIQDPSGGVYSSTALRQTRVFNTGQVILGWCVLFERTGEKKYLEAAVRAGEYLLKRQNSDGTWTQDTFCGARTYHARVDWALLRLAKLTGENRFVEAAYQNLQWVVAQQHENGWFDHCGFINDRPITHVIDYTLRGLLECHFEGTLASRVSLMPRVIKGVDALCAAIERIPLNGIEGMVPCSFDDRWDSPDTHSCLTGNAQIAYLLYRLTHLTKTKTKTYSILADKIIKSLKRTQNLEIAHEPVKGAVGGSYPLFKGYAANSYPNWGSKFFADALLIKINSSDQYSILA